MLCLHVGLRVRSGHGGRSRSCEAVRQVRSAIGAARRIGGPPSAPPPGRGRPPGWCRRRRSCRRRRAGRPGRCAQARNCAAPGGVRSTTRLPLASALSSSSRDRPGQRASRQSRRAAGRRRTRRQRLAGRRAPRPRPGYVTGARRPAAVRAAQPCTAPSSSRSRDSVAWVTWTPLGGQQVGQLAPASGPAALPRIAGDPGLPGGLGHRADRRSPGTAQRRAGQQPGEQRLLRVQPVLGLVEDGAVRAVDAPRR